MINIAIDGPAGAGKSTIAKEVAHRLSFIYVDTGAMYRALALACIRDGVSAEDKEGVVKSCENASVTIEYVNGEQCVQLNGENVNPYIRSEEVSKMSSSISAYGEIRSMLLNLQRNLARNNNVIMDGRDIGTAVLPDADVKIYLTARTEIRAKRRFEQLRNKDSELSIDAIEKEIIERDNRDMNRKIAPLKIAENAVLVDTSNLSIEEAISTITEIIHDRVR
ncbi:(d)CMP kinase [Parasporobacterium paucivorans]|uniref:Cytidylate kinase n=2 Tax=Parasporobacterium TaxID=115543 RepID=A0A1M6F768_9FIRM|nr:(d)CMP kinase [Parasporobacterium paucivorans]SHI93439.1 cytidylate kinase [Parasporobacterium paucivorans DSM 15970]